MTYTDRDRAVAALTARALVHAVALPPDQAESELAAIRELAKIASKP